MKINFDSLAETVIPNFYNGEKSTKAHMYVDNNIKIMKGCLESGASIGLHTHETSLEVIYFLSGKGKVICEDKEEFYQSGECHYCAKNQQHTLINASDENLTFFAVVPNV